MILNEDHPFMARVHIEKNQDAIALAALLVIAADHEKRDTSGKNPDQLALKFDPTGDIMRTFCRLLSGLSVEPKEAPIPMLIGPMSQH